MWLGYYTPMLALAIKLNETQCDLSHVPRLKSGQRRIYTVKRPLWNGNNSVITCKAFASRARYNHTRMGNMRRIEPRSLP